MKTLTVYCWRSGQIDFGPTVPDGAISLGTGPEAKLRKAVGTIARHAYPAKRAGKTDVMLVPGVPEAASEESSLDALDNFTDRLKYQLGGKLSDEMKRVLRLVRSSRCAIVSEYGRYWVRKMIRGVPSSVGPSPSVPTVDALLARGLLQFHDREKTTVTLTSVGENVADNLLGR